MEIKKRRRYSSLKMVLPALGFMAAGAFISHTIVVLKQKFTSSPTSSQGRIRIPGDAWTLVVTLTFTSEEDKTSILEAWRPVTKYCAEEEPFVYHYEAGQDGSNPLKIYLVERYKTIDNYLNQHKSSEEFLKFRPQLQALQDAGKVTVEGFSFNELGYGFV
jgi:quinol monooxygenase YgiN